jgi:hypothetical protein
MSRIGLATVSMVVVLLSVSGATASAQGACSSSTPQYCPTPSVVTGTATVTTNSAVLTGSVNPNGADTTCAFVYGATATYGQTSPVQTFTAGATTVTVSAGITGLSPATPYHDRLICHSAGGYGFGSDATFTTSSSTAPPPPVYRSRIRIAPGGHTVSKGGVVKFKLQCKGLTTCKGKLSLSTLHGKKLANSVKYNISGHHSKTIKLKLTKKALKQLKKAKHHREKARPKAADSDRSTAKRVVSLHLA